MDKWSRELFRDGARQERASGSGVDASPSQATVSDPASSGEGTIVMVSKVDVDDATGVESPASSTTKTRFKRAVDNRFSVLETTARVGAGQTKGENTPPKIRDLRSPSTV